MLIATSPQRAQTSAMPSFYPFDMPRQLPLTPPDLYDTYPDSAVGLTYQSSQCASQDSQPSQYGKRDLSHQAFTRTSGYPLAPVAHTASAKENELRTTNGIIFPGHTVPSGMNSSTVPMLPPIYVLEQTSTDVCQPQSKATAPVPPNKEEKATGGVAAHLDYEMDHMAEFVAEMAQGMYDLYASRICLADIDILRSVNPKASVAPAFRKYVLQVLSSTRLPSSTILLALHYLATRMNMLSSGGRYPSGKGQVYRMLTMALLLGSKFLDDNTFQNRSWSEVSSIPVNELNDLEIEWLVAIGWDLHVNSDDSQGFKLWRKHWQRRQAKRLEMSLDSLKLTPLDVNVQRLQKGSKIPSSPMPTYSHGYHGPMYNSAGAQNQSMDRWHTAQYDRWPSVQAKTEYSPPSAPETGPTTPEWYGGSTDCEYARHSYQTSFTNASQPISHCSYPSIRQPTYSHPYTPHPYSQPWMTRKWNGHAISCSCMGCLPAPDRYLIGSGYRLQSVFG